MTNDNETANSAPDVSTDLVVIDALLDGEYVNAQELRLALDDPTTRDYLVDVLALRQRVGAMAPLNAPVAQPSRSVRPRVLWGAGAVAAMAIAVGGYALGARTAERASEEAAAKAAIPDVQVAQGVVAPPPTQVIELVPGENWHVTGGK